MQAINHAISPEQLELAHRLFEKVPLLTEANRVDTLDRRLRVVR